MEAKRARRNKILIAWGTFFSSFGFFFLAGKLEQPWFVFVGLSGTPEIGPAIKL
jgi:hypothetical protein